MKFIIVLSLIIISCLTHVEAQVTRAPKFDTCNQLRSLEGEWVNITNNDTIRIYLRFSRNFTSDPETFNYTTDELWGWVEYKQGNTIIMSDYSNRFANLPYNLDSLTPGFRSIVIWKNGTCQNPQINLSGGFSDIVRCRQNKNITATVNSSGTQMTWKLVQPTALLDNMWCAGLTLPQEFTLVKQ